MTLPEQQTERGFTMTYLDCTVTGCIYNEDKCCCKNDIKIEGRSAEASHETCCGSFRERGEKDGKNAVKRVSKETNVECEACNCTFNEKGMCSAEHIGVAGGNACTCGETECASFRCE